MCFCLTGPNPTAYQGKTSISTVGTSTSAYRLSLATMSRSNTGTGTVWEQDSQPSRQPSQDTLSRTDEDDEESQKTFCLPFSFTFDICRNFELNSLTLHPSPSRRLHEYPQRGERARGLFAQGDGTAPFLQPRHRLSGFAARGPPHHHAAKPQVT